MATKRTYTKETSNFTVIARLIELVSRPASVSFDEATIERAVVPSREQRDDLPDRLSPEARHAAVGNSLSELFAGGIARNACRAFPLASLECVSCTRATGPHPCLALVNLHEKLSKFLQIAVLRILRVDPTPWIQPSSNGSTLNLDGACRGHDCQWKGQFPLTMVRVHLGIVLGITGRYLIDVYIIQRYLLANLKVSMALRECARRVPTICFI